MNYLSSGFSQLDNWAEGVRQRLSCELGFPVNQEVQLQEFYDWYISNNLIRIGLNNAGNPFTESTAPLSAHQLEREVLRFFAPLYGFDPDHIWGFISASGTDGNNHGIYFGRKHLKNITGGQEPIMYVSDEAHYSNTRLADLQGIELRLIPSDKMGHMDPREFERQLDPSRPCLVVFAVGSTFKGVIDDQKAINDIISRHPDMAVYRHVDAALFGGYLPFTQYSDVLNRKLLGFDSIAVSGHKFFGMDEPAGMFLTTRLVYDNQTSYRVPYLNDNMKMVACSRSVMPVLKFWWFIHHVGREGWTRQATQILENSAYLYDRLHAAGYPCWRNPLSNTIFMQRPREDVVKRYDLPQQYDQRLGGYISHVVVMQHVTKETIDQFIKDITTTI